MDPPPAGNLVKAMTAAPAWSLPRDRRARLEPSDAEPPAITGPESALRLLHIGMQRDNLTGSI